METRLDHRRSACSNFINKVRSRPAWDLGLLKPKSVTFSQEFMFTRSLFQTPDMIEQHNLLGRVAALIDEGVLKTTLSKVVPELTPLTLARAHAELEAGRMVGKLVIDMSGFAS